MTALESQLCDIQGRLFELSAHRGIASKDFVAKYMTSKTCEDYDAPYHRLQWCGEEYLLDELSDEYTSRGVSLPQGEVYTRDELYWMGYLYRYWHFLRKEASRVIYRQAPVGMLKKVYPGFHTLDESMAIENLEALVSQSD
jgi:hypothetical protein